MSINQEVDGIVAVPVAEPPAEASNGHAMAEAPAQPAPVAEVVATPARGRPRWLVPTAIAAVGVIAAGSLGFLLYSTIKQRDTLHAQLVATKGSLASTQQQLAAAQADASAKKVTADYVALYIADEGKVLTDYQSTIGCNGYSACRTSAQQFLADMQAFQADRKSANVPLALQSQDSSLGDALSAAIAGDQELISGMDNGDVPKITEGGNKVDSAMLNLAKAEAAMGTQLK